MKRGTRPRKNRIEVWCDNDELAKIKANAESTRLSNSEFLRNLGKGYEPKSTFDKEPIMQLAKLHADQCRLGGLLEQCLFENKGSRSPVKNWLFAGSNEGGKNAAILCSFIASCKQYGINPQQYLTDVLTRLSNGESNLDSLLPGTWSLAML